MLSPLPCQRRKFQAVGCQLGTFRNTESIVATHFGWPSCHAPGTRRTDGGMDAGAKDGVQDGWQNTTVRSMNQINLRSADLGFEAGGLVVQWPFDLLDGWDGMANSPVKPHMIGTPLILLFVPPYVWPLRSKQYILTMIAISMIGQHQTLPTNHDCTVDPLYQWLTTNNATVIMLNDWPGNADRIMNHDARALTINHSQPSSAIINTCLGWLIFA